MSVSLNNDGIYLSIGEQSGTRLIRDPRANQIAPRRSYIYGHFDSQDVPFYIGKGTGRRAWERNRHSLWSRFVEKRLNGNFSVVILLDDLDPERAEYIESLWIAQESATLVNWVNMSRGYDAAALDRYHALRNECLRTQESAKALEKTDIDLAIAHWYSALDMLSKYAGINSDVGLVGELLREEANDLGIRGDINILDRLTLSLKKVGRLDEAATETVNYLRAYRRDIELSMTPKILKRVGIAQLPR